MRVRAPDRFPDAALNRLDEASSVQVSGRPYLCGIFPERQDRCHGRRKTARNDRRDFRACHRNRVGGRTMDFTALVRGSLGAVMTAFLSFVVHRSLMDMTVPMVAGVVNRVLDAEAQPCIAMQSSGICVGEKPRLKGRHDKEHDRKHRRERYVSKDRDSTKVPHRALPTIVRLICQGRLPPVCCVATKSERNHLPKCLPFRFTSGSAQPLR